MLHQTGSLRGDGSNIYTYLYMRKDLSPSSYRHQKSLRYPASPSTTCCFREFPAIIPPVGRRQSDARSIDEPSPATLHLLGGVGRLGPDLVRMRRGFGQKRTRGR